VILAERAILARCRAHLIGGDAQSLPQQLGNHGAGGQFAVVGSVGWFDELSEEQLRLRAVDPVLRSEPAITGVKRSLAVLLLALACALGSLLNVHIRGHCLSVTSKQYVFALACKFHHRPASRSSVRREGNPAELDLGSPCISGFLKVNLGQGWGRAHSDYSNLACGQNRIRERHHHVGEDL
jgi:hypothetical protein